jgi:DNA-binding winged helix-turn-helix (wHTH) protein/TolB-like protein/Flp pilus assembly protein TadD
MSDLFDRRRRLAFGPFVVDPVRRRLFRDGESVPVTPRAFDTLVVLMDGRGRVVEKDELMRALWPDTVVEEINLNVQISTLRKALGEQPNDHRFIVTVLRRGFAFVAEVSEVVDEAPDAEAAARALSVDASPPAFRRPVDASATPRLRPPSRSVLAMATVVLLTVIGLPMVIRTGLSATTRGPQTSIAVLPFRTLDENADGALAVGLTDALITQLGTVENLSVCSTTSVLACSASSTDPIAAGRELGVRTVLDGKIQSLENRLRVTVQLLDVHDASTIWTETIDEQHADAFSLQDAIAGRIGRSLTLRLTSVDAPPDGQRRVNPEAYALYLRGRHHWNKRTDQDIRIAVEYFRRAVETDGTAALAWSGLADSYALLSIYGRLPADEAFAKAREASDRALALDDTLSEAHASRASVLMRYDRNFAGARVEFERAIELDPGNATAQHWYGEMLMQSGASEAAIDRLRHASQLDPLSLVVQSDLAWAYYYARRYDEAAELSRRVLWLDSSFRPARQCLALVLIQQGEHAAALTECAKADLSGSGIAGTALAGLDREAQARAILQQLRWSYRKGNKGAYAAARVFAALGEPSSAVRWLRHAIRAREGQVAYLAIDPAFDSLRSEPAFQHLLSELST